MFVNPVINTLSRLYSILINLGENLHSLFLLVIRLVWGHQFFLSGYHKLSNMPQTIQAFASMHLSSFEAHLVAYTESIGGLCLIVGLASRLVSVPLTIAMVSALGIAHAHAFAGFHWIADPSILTREAPFPFLMATLTVFIFGPGRLSLDAWIKRRSQHWKQF